jgi:hypothetical protein
MPFLPTKASTKVSDDEVKEAVVIMTVGTIAERRRFLMRFVMRRPWLLDTNDLIDLANTARYQRGWVKVEAEAYLVLVGLTVSAAFLTGLFIGTRFLT